VARRAGGGQDEHTTISTAGLSHTCRTMIQFVVTGRKGGYLLTSSSEVKQGKDGDGDEPLLVNHDDIAGATNNGSYDHNDIAFTRCFLAFFVATALEVRALGASRLSMRKCRYLWSTFFGGWYNWFTFSHRLIGLSPVVAVVAAATLLPQC